MTDHSPEPALRLEVSRLLGRLGLYATFGAAVLFLLIIAGDLDVLVRHAALVGWLALLVGTGPLVATLLSTLASYVNYYGVWRILRGHDEFDAKDDLQSHAADLPETAQALLAGRAGCVQIVSVALLVGSLLLSVVTTLPSGTPVVGILSAWSDHLRNPAPQALHSIPVSFPTPTATLTPAPTMTTTPIPTAAPTPVIKFSMSPTTASWNCHNQGMQPAPQSLTLDNRGSTVAVSWRASAVEHDSAGDLWAVIRPANGTVPAHGTQMISVNPDPQNAENVCLSSSANGTPWHVNVVANGVGTLTFTYTISYYLT
jgi:hypothetical protein